MLINDYIYQLKEQDKKYKKNSQKNEISFKTAIRSDLLKEDYFRFLEEKQKSESLYSGGDSDDVTSSLSFSLFLELL
jgi:hypothetical protein